MSSKFTAIVFGALGIWLALIVVAAQTRYLATQRELDAGNDRIASSQREHARLTDELERMKQPAWLALLARARLNYKKPDETVVFVYKSEKGSTVDQLQATPEEKQNWKKWLDWVRIKN